MCRYITLLLAILFTVIIIFNPAFSEDKQEVYLYLARSLFERGDYQSSLKNFKLAAKYGDLSPQDRALQAICYVKTGDLKSAKTMVDELLKKYPQNSLALLANGILEFEKKNFEEAYRSFKKAWETDSKLVQARIGMASSLVNMGVRVFEKDHQKAEEYFKKALAVAPGYIPALQNLAVIEFNRGNYNRSFKYISNILKYDPANLKALEIEFYIYYKKSDLDGQKKTLLRLVSINPGNAEYWAMLGKVYELKGEYKKAVEAYSRARRLNSSNPYPYLKLAEHYFKKNKRELALYIAREGVGRAVYLIGTLRIGAAKRLQRLKERPTKEDLETIREMAKSIEEPRKILEKLLALLKKITGGGKSYESELARLVRRYPHTPELKIALAQYYTDRHDYKRAVAVWRMILIKHSRNITAYKGIAYCYEKMGDEQRALKTYRIALDIDPEDESIYSKIIELSKKLGMLNELYGEWMERLYMDRRNPVLLRAIAEIEKELGEYEKAEEHLKRADKVEAENRAYLEKQSEKEK